MEAWLLKLVKAVKSLSKLYSYSTMAEENIVEVV